MTGPVLYGEEPEETAQRELAKQTGLTATFAVRSFLRERDYVHVEDSRSMLRDRLFFVLEATAVTGQLSNQWPGGENHWMTVAEFRGQGKSFPSAYRIIDMVRDGITYDS